MLNILIADDNDSNIYVLEMLIEEWFEENNIQNYNIDSVLNGAEAIKKLEEKEYDVLFLDIMMPVMDGFEALKEIRDRNLNPQTKIIVASAVIDDELNKNKAKSLNANAFIVKPLSYDTINIMLTKYLKDKDISQDEATKNSTSYIYFDNNNETNSNKLDSFTFLSEYPEDIIDNEDIEELHHFVSNFNQNISTLDDFNKSIDEFRQIIEKSRLMILSFTELQNLNILLNEINSFCYNLHNQNLINEDIISKHFLTIAEKISNWFEEVFVEKTSQDILAIENRVLNDFLILKEMLSKK